MTLDPHPSPLPPPLATTGAAPPPLVLDGRKDVKLVSVAVAGRKLEAGEYQLTDKTLTLSGLPEGEL